MQVHGSCGKRSGEGDGNDAEAKQHDTGALKVEDLLRRIAHLEGENKRMSDKLAEIQEEIRCSICFETSDDDVVFQCGHNFCKPCSVKWNGTGQRNARTCPTCRTGVAQNAVYQHRAFRRITDSLRTDKVYPDGRQYTGEFKDGKANGKGTMIWPQGNPATSGKFQRYEGEFVDDLPHGKGKMSIFEGRLRGEWDVYEGEFHQGLKHGQGKLEHGDKHRYEGQFSNNKINGKGTYTWPDGDVYVGDFVNGIRRGHGTLSYADGRKYVGNWDFSRNGKGTYTWPNGDVYVGDWFYGRRTGRGTLVYANGTKYIGEFKSNMKHGQGRMEYPDGHVESSSWFEDEQCDDEVFEFLQGRN